MANITVGAGQQHSTISSAVAAARNGDVLLVQGGTYVNDFAYIDKDITLQGVGGTVHMQATMPPSNGKAILVTDGNINISNFEFSGVANASNNGAGIRHEGGNLALSNTSFHDNQMGLLTVENAAATLTIRNSEFYRNGSEPAHNHNLYVNGIAKLTVDSSYFHDATIGHNLKSRALETVITNSRFADFQSTGSYSIDIPNGGRAVLENNVIEQGPNSQNPVIVAFCAEGNDYPGSSITMTGNTIINYNSDGLLLWNVEDAPATLTNTRVFGLDASQLTDGAVSVSGTTYLASAPAFDTSPPSGGVTSPAPSDPVTPPSDPVELPDPVTSPSDPVELPDPVTSPSDPAVPPNPGASPPDSGEAGGVLRGTTGRDSLVAGDGDDTVIGNWGRDTIDGGAGDDLLAGGLGSDVFVFSPNFGNDTVRDFSTERTWFSNHDILDLRALGVTAANFESLVSIEQQGGNVLIAVRDQGTIVLQDKSTEAFDTSHILIG